MCNESKGANKVMDEPGITLKDTNSAINEGRKAEAKVTPLKMFIMAFILVSSGTILVERLAVTMTPSVGYHLFVLNKGAAIFNRGDYVFVEGLVTPFINDGEEFNIIKPIACAPGDHLENRDRHFFCNGKPVAIAKKKSLDGKLLTHFTFNGAVPKGMYFISSGHKDGYDSRYFGFISKERISARAYPVI